MLCVNCSYQYYHRTTSEKIKTRVLCEQKSDNATHCYVTSLKVVNYTDNQHFYLIQEFLFSFNWKAKEI